MIVSQVPLTVQLKEIEEYFNTLITNIDTKISKNCFLMKKKIR